MGMLKIRKDRTPAALRKLARAETDVRVARRLLAIANALSGMSRAEAARSAGMDRQTLRDWVIRYNEHGVAGLSDSWNGGRPPKLTMDEQAELLAIVMAGPDPEKDGFCAYTRDDLVAIAKKKIRQADASDVDGPAASKARTVAAEGEAQPPDERPGRRSGL
jgi:transposase